MSETVKINGDVGGEVLTLDGENFVSDGTLTVGTVPYVYGRMLNYYPPVIRELMEFKAIVRSEYPEFEEFSTESKSALADAYWYTMSESRIAEWEKALGIIVVPGSTVDDRRDTVIARIRGQGKLNTSLINLIVNTFTGGTAISWIQDSTLCVEITPPPKNKQFLFENVTQELSAKVPAHLGLYVTRNYSTWDELQRTATTWGDINDNFANWQEVILFSPAGNTYSLERRS